MSFYNQEERFNYSIDNKEKMNEEKIDKLEEQLNNINNQLLTITELLGNINNILLLSNNGKINGFFGHEIINTPYKLNYCNNKDFLNIENNTRQNTFNLN